ncbi:MAG: copper-binding protein [Nitrosomonas sp.]|nr:copper-binding protein [Nitrosomonas sp.]
MFVLIILSGVLAHATCRYSNRSTGRNGRLCEGIATVKAIDMNQGIVKLAHGPIASLKWPSMTMNFKIKDRAFCKKSRWIML